MFARRQTGRQAGHVCKDGGKQADSSEGRQEVRQADINACPDIIGSVGHSRGKSKSEDRPDNPR